MNMTAREHELYQALRNVVWKLNRKEQHPNCKDYEWAKIDKRDAVIRHAERVLNS